MLCQPVRRPLCAPGQADPPCVPGEARGSNAEKLERSAMLCCSACGINDHFAKEVPDPQGAERHCWRACAGGPLRADHQPGMLRCTCPRLCTGKSPKGHYGLVLQDYAHFTAPSAVSGTWLIQPHHECVSSRLPTRTPRSCATTILRSGPASSASEREGYRHADLSARPETGNKAEYGPPPSWARANEGRYFRRDPARPLSLNWNNRVEGFVPASSPAPLRTMLTRGRAPFRKKKKPRLPAELSPGSIP